MGIDKARGSRKNTHRKNPASKDAYLRLLVKLYSFLSRRVEDAPFNKIVLRRLYMSRINRPCLSLSKLAQHMEGREKQTAVVVATVVNDNRLLKVPKLTVAALRFTETARKRILAAGGECLTLDQLALRAPKGQNTNLLQGRRSKREVVKHFGVPGAPGSHVKPKVLGKGRKVEKARGRRKSHGWKV